MCIKTSNHLLFQIICFITCLLHGCSRGNFVQIPIGWFFESDFLWGLFSDFWEAKSNIVTGKIDHFHSMIITAIRNTGVVWNFKKYVSKFKLVVCFVFYWQGTDTKMSLEMGTKSVINRIGGKCPLQASCGIKLMIFPIIEGLVRPPKTDIWSHALKL